MFLTQDFFYTHQFQWERFKKEREPCFSGIIREEAPFCRHCFVSLSNPWSIIKGLTDITAFTASSHLAEWPGNNTQMKWQAIKSKYRSCKQKQNSRWGQGYFIVFSVLNLSLIKMWLNRFSCPEKKEDPLKNSSAEFYNFIIWGKQANKETSSTFVWSRTMSKSMLWLLEKLFFMVNFSKCFNRLYIPYSFFKKNFFPPNQGIDFLAFALSRKDLLLPQSITVTSSGQMHSCSLLKFIGNKPGKAVWEVVFSWKVRDRQLVKTVQSIRVFCLGNSVVIFWTSAWK